ncbi:MAG: helicase-related protein [Chloroflexota bacterium]|nr:helicase-related protein [Chloroflexota bacterium]
MPLWEGVLEKFGKVTLHNVAERKTVMKEFGPQQAASGIDVMLEVLVRGMNADEQMLIFRTHVNPTETTALALARSLPVKPVSNNIKERIMLLEDSPLRSFLERYVERRVAYHNAGLSVEERRLVEHLFKEGVLQVLVTTATLSAGVNLPADKVVIADYRRFDPGRRTQVPIDVAEYKNCAGRAGRFGKRAEGVCLLLTTVPGQTRILERQYIYGSPLALESAIPSQPDLARHVLGVVAEQLANTASDVLALFRDSLAFLTFYGPRGAGTELDKAIESGIERLLSLSSELRT